MSTRQWTSLLDVCRVSPPHAFSWFGKSTSAVSSRLRALDPAAQRQILVATLTERLYQDAYTVGAPRPTPPADEHFLLSQDRRFAHELERANSSEGGWEPGWTVTDECDDTVAVESGGLRLWIRPNDLVPVPSGTGQVGETVSVRMPRGSFELSPGYYCAFSDTPGVALAASRQVLRLYLAVTPAGAAPAMATVTRTLNDARIPFRFKILTSPTGYERADSAVVYFAIEDLEAMTGSLPRMVPALRPHLRDVVPMFTLRVHAGIGIAEEPTGSQHSFGQHRCAAVAEGLVRAAEAKANGAGRLAHVLSAAAEAGIDPDLPHLGSGSPPDPCAYLVTAVATASATVTVTVGEGPAPTAPSVTDERGEARTIVRFVGERLVAEAVRHQDRCTWLSVVPTSDDQGHPTLAYGDIGSDVYDGTAGVGLFLAVLGATTGSAAAVATAAAAARQSLRRAASSGTGRGAGLYLGDAGIAVAAATTATIVGDEDLFRQASRWTSTSAPVGPDLLMGAAGTILALLTLAELTGDPRHVASAASHGNTLINGARRAGAGWSWGIPGGGRGPHLTGLSHGASGIAAALLELADVTGRADFLEAGLRAVDYERSWFDPVRQNWPDLRDVSRVSTPPTTYLSQWCHGAPGVALTRLRAVQLLTDARLEQEAVAALKTTLATTLFALEEGTLSYSLCHGIAGNLEVLLDGEHLLSDDERDQVHTLVRDFAHRAATRQVEAGWPWPCGVPVPGAEVPGLFLGTAGIGYHFLRACFPQRVPSVLLLRPHEFASRVRALTRPAAEPEAVARETIGSHCA